MFNTVRRFLVGSPLPTAAEMYQRLTKLQALAVFSSDALSSVAYATEEILLVLILAGPAVLGLSLPIARSGRYHCHVVSGVNAPVRPAPKRWTARTIRGPLSLPRVG